MATMETLRERVRVRLEEVTPAVWTDDEIDECIVGALETCGWLFPNEEIADIAVPEGARSIEVPGHASDVRRVLLANGDVVPKRGAPRGPTRDEELAWELFAGVLHFTQPLAGQTVTLWLTAAPTLDDLASRDEGLVVRGAVVQALESRAIQELKRGGTVTLAGAEVVMARMRDAFEREVVRRSRRVRAGLTSAP